MNLVERFLSLLWDPSGRRRGRQTQRLMTTAQKIRALQASQQAAAEQIVVTQRFVASHTRKE